MPLSIFYPTPPLDRYIKFYWILEDCSVTASEESVRIIPTACPEMTFYFGDKYYTLSEGNSKIYQPDFVLSGQKSTFTDLCPTGRAGIFSVMFKPHGAGMFFDMPLNSIFDYNVSISDIIGDKVRTIQDALANAGNREKVLIMESFLKGMLKEKKNDNFARISAAISSTDANSGNIDIKALSDISCWSTKQFQRNFSDLVGITPKQFTRTVRFQYTIFVKQNNPKISLTELSHLCGYYDQSHFINEFRHFTGMTPKEYFKNEEICSDYFAA